jgi:hypothetical protein
MDVFSFLLLSFFLIGSFVVIYCIYMGIHSFFLKGNPFIKLNNKLSKLMYNENTRTSSMWLCSGRCLIYYMYIVFSVQITRLDTFVFAKIIAWKTWFPFFCCKQPVLLQITLVDEMFE